MLFPETVIVGCGNLLYADDGFGPAVISQLRAYTLPPGVKAVDAGTGGIEFVFSLLDPAITRRLIVIDIADFGGEPGSITVIPISDLPAGSITDHNLGGLAETLLSMKDTIEIMLVGCQPKVVSYPELHLGLCGEVELAIPQAVQAIQKILVEKRSCHFSTPGQRPIPHQYPAFLPESSGSAIDTVPRSSCEIMDYDAVP